MLESNSGIFKIRGEVWDLSVPKVMGIVNITPDSFYAKSRYTDDSLLVDAVGQMVVDGVDVVDIGAMSSRPGSLEIGNQEEIDRLIPAMMAIKSAFPELLLSVDTYRSEVLREAAIVGVDMVNDISAGRMDDTFLSMVGELGLIYILMHMQGTPSSMQVQPHYNDIVLELLSWFSERLYTCRSHEIYDVIIDPGFGFGKTIQDNYTLLKNLNTFEILECPILVGVSRKSMIYKLLGVQPEEALSGTIAANMLALQGGAMLLRVHDVASAVASIKIFNAYNSRELV